MPNSTEVPEGWTLVGNRYEKTLVFEDGRESRIVVAAALVADGNIDLAEYEAMARERAVFSPVLGSGNVG